MTPLSERLSQLAERRGYGDGRRTALWSLLDSRGYSCSLISVCYWLSGVRQPSLAALAALLDALEVHGPEREEVVRLALPEGLL